MFTTNTTYKKDILNEFISKLHRYRWFILGAIALAIVSSVIGSLISHITYDSSRDTARVMYLGNVSTIYFPLIIGAILMLIMNMPSEQRYQSTHTHGRLTPMLTNSAFSIILAVTFALILTFTPAFMAICGVLGAITSKGYYDNVLLSATELLIDFGINLLLTIMIFGTINKVMYYLKTKPLLLIFWAIALGAGIGLSFLIYYMLRYFDLIQPSITTTLIFMTVTMLVYEISNIIIRYFAIKKGDISR